MFCSRNDGAEMEMFSMLTQSSNMLSTVVREKNLLNKVISFVKSIGNISTCGSLRLILMRCS